MVDRAQLKFIEYHNLTAYFGDPPAAYQEFKSLVDGLNVCRIAHALRENPVIFKDMILEFWNTAITSQTHNGIEAKVQGTLIIVTEEIIREVLLFGDQPDHPTFYPNDSVLEVLRRMSYEGNYPPTEKKLLHPYWRMLAHIIMMCMSTVKGGGIDSLNKSQSSALVALTMDWDYNFSRYILDEMKDNLKAKKGKFIVFPRFIQLILNAKYPSLEKSMDTHHVKAMGSNIFGLMKQSREKAKVSYQNLRPLEKFGRFGETVIDPAVLRDDFVEEEHNIEAVRLEEDEEAIEILTNLQKHSENPPFFLSSAIEDQVERDPESSLVRKKRKRNDPRRGLIDRTSETSEPAQTSEPIKTSEPTQIIVGSESMETETSAQLPVSSEPQVASERPLSSSGERAGQFHQLQDEYLMTSRGKGIAAESGFDSKMHFDFEDNVERLQQRVFTLEQGSIVKDLRIQELETSDRDNKAKISSLETELGHLTVVFVNLKQLLQSKFGSDFADSPDQPGPIGGSGEAGTGSSSGRNETSDPQSGPSSSRPKAAAKVREAVSKTKSKKFKTVMWPPTRKMKTIPIADGCLSDFKSWCFDSNAWSMVIQCESGEYVFADPIDLLRFGESDIRVLSQNHIKSEDIHKEEAKKWTSSVAVIIENEVWAGSKKDD